MAKPKRKRAQVAKLGRVLERITELRAGLGDLSSPIWEIPDADRATCRKIERLEKQAAELFVAMAAARPVALKTAHRVSASHRAGRGHTKNTGPMLAIKKRENDAIREKLRAAGDFEKLAQLDKVNERKKRYRARQAAAGRSRG